LNVDLLVRELNFHSQPMLRMTLWKNRQSLEPSRSVREPWRCRGALTAKNTLVEVDATRVEDGFERKV